MPNGFAGFCCTGICICIGWWTTAAGAAIAVIICCCSRKACCCCAMAAICTAWGAAYPPDA